MRPRISRPQVVGADRHFTQGAVELADVQWDEKQNRLSGTAIGSAGMEWTLAIHVPAGYSVDDQTGIAHLQQDQAEANLLKARLKFVSDRTASSIGFTR